LRREFGLLIPSIAPFQIMLTPSIVESAYGSPRELAHGGEPMGSLMMALKPGRVDLTRVGEFGRKRVLGLPTDGLSAVKLENVRIALPIDVREVAPESGSLGDPAGATAERGAAILSQTVEACVGFMNWFRSVDPTVVKD
jgi:creatinine amidohydrolase